MAAEEPRKAGTVEKGATQAAAAAGTVVGTVERKIDNLDLFNEESTPLRQVLKASREKVNDAMTSVVATKVSQEK
jgi:hypothetical protein